MTDTQAPLTNEQSQLRLDIEQRVKAIWLDILGVPDVQLVDHFVELGGDSIGAALCRNQVKRSLGIDMEADACLATDMTFGRLIEHLVNSSLRSSSGTPEP